MLVASRSDPYYSPDRYPKWEPSFRDLEYLKNLADQALQPDSPLLCWYSLGAILGDCEIAGGSKAFTVVELDKFIGKVRELPQIYIDDVRVLKQLLEFSGESLSPQDRLRRAIELSELASMKPLSHNPNHSDVIAFHDAIALDLSHLEISEDHRSQDARDAWIYRRVLAGDTYKQIRADLKQRPEWEWFASIQGIRSAAIEYAKRHKKDELPKRRPGRPRSNKN